MTHHVLTAVRSTQQQPVIFTGCLQLCIPGGGQWRRPFFQMNFDFQCMSDLKSGLSPLRVEAEQSDTFLPPLWAVRSTPERTKLNSLSLTPFPMVLFLQLHYGKVVFCVVVKESVNNNYDTRTCFVIKNLEVFRTVVPVGKFAKL